MIKDTYQVELDKLASQMSAKELRKRVNLAIKHHANDEINQGHKAPAMGVADYIIKIENKCYHEKPKQCCPITNLYLQKLMYYLNVIYLLKFHRPLITDKRFKTWNYGPTIVSVFHEYNFYGGNIIPKPVHHIASYHAEDSGTNPIYYPKGMFSIDEKTKNFINHNIHYFNHFGPFQLVSYSHQETQWKHRKSYNTTYNDFKTIAYYSLPWHQFWKK